MEYGEVIENTKKIIAELIMKVNVLESSVKEIISGYLNSDKEEFVRDVLLNNLIINLSSKVKALNYIIRAEKLEIDTKELNKALRIAMTKRNIIAHSDGLLDPDLDLVDIDVDWNRDGSFITPIFEHEIPVIQTFENGKINFTDINKIANDFNKYYEIAFDLLNQVKEKLGFEFYENPFSVEDGEEGQVEITEE